MADRDLRLRLNPAATATLTSGVEARALTKDVGDRVAERARQLAPKDSGAGAASIHAEVHLVDGGWVADVSYDRAHFYMGFAEVGTAKRSPRPFLRPALTDTQL